MNIIAFAFFWIVILPLVSDKEEDKVDRESYLGDSYIKPLRQDGK